MQGNPPGHRASSRVSVPSMGMLLAAVMLFAACSEGAPDPPASEAITTDPSPTPRARMRSTPVRPADDTGLAVNTVRTHLGAIQRVAVAADGTMVLASGTQLFVDHGRGPEPFAWLTGAEVFGLALAPDFQRQGSIYVLLGNRDGSAEVRRFLSDDETFPPGEVVGWWDRQPSWEGNALAFGEDGSLYAALDPLEDASADVNLSALVAAVAAQSQGGPGSPTPPRAIEDACLDLSATASAWVRVDGQDDVLPPRTPFVGVPGVRAAHLYEDGAIAAWGHSVLAVTSEGNALRIPLDQEDCLLLDAASLVARDQGAVLDLARDPEGTLYLLLTGASRHAHTATTRLARLLPEADVDLLYPDLRTQPPSDLEFSVGLIEEEWRPVLRFTNIVMNLGEGPLELYDSGQGTEVVQRLYATDGSYVERYAGDVVYHWSHAHWHFEDFNRFELWLRDDYERMLSGEATAPQWVEEKVSMCLMDVLPIDEDLPGHPEVGRYSDECAFDAQGLSVGWGDIYFFDVPEQWVSLDNPLGDGRYVLRSIVDAENLFFESPGGQQGDREDAHSNGATVWFSIAGGYLQVEHTESGAGDRWAGRPARPAPSLTSTVKQALLMADRPVTLPHPDLFCPIDPEGRVF